ncbi:MAG: EAL domain-containing protein [Hyphomicrobiales bacterium]
MKNQYTQLVAILLISLLGFAAAIKISIDHAVEALLVEEAHDVGMDWAHLIDERIQTLLSNSDKEQTDQLLNTEDVVTLAEIANGIFSVGNIFQIDFINSSCHCEATFVRPMPGAGGETSVHGGHSSHGEHQGHAHHEETLRGSMAAHSEYNHASENSGGTVSISEGGHFQHVFNSAAPHMPMHYNAAPDATKVREIIKSGIHEIAIVNQIDGDFDMIVAKVYHPVFWGGEVRYVLRVLVDMTETSIGFTKVFQLGVATLLLLLFLSFAYPAYKYFRSARAHRLLDAHTHFLANHDVLTGISNRNAFQQQAPKRINLCRHAKHEGVLLVVDINGFKEINDFHGHQVGDEVLKKVASLLEGLVSKDCIVARLGGDEFGVLSCETHLKNYVESGDIQLPNMVELDINGCHEKLNVSFSVGFARYPAHGLDLSELMRNADLALYAAKKDGKGGAREYDPTMSQVFKDRLNLFKEFRKGLLASQIEPYYQPLVNVATGQVEGFEALARWNHPEMGVLSAADFAEVLDDREICGLIGREMLAKVTADMGQWKAAGIEFGSVGLNVDSADLLRPAFILDVISNLAKHELTPKNLAIEVTENTVFGANYELLLKKLREFRDLGCYVALDDFGTGYSSITHLKELPYTAIKIDKSFVRDIVTDKLDQSIVEALVHLSETIGYQLVAEGVETRAQLDAVSKLGCHLIQGYYYAKPLAASEVPNTLNRINQMGNLDTGVVHKFAYTG